MELLNKIFINRKTEELRGEWKALLFLSIWIAIYAPEWFAKPGKPLPSLSQNDVLLFGLIQSVIFIPVLLGESAISARLLEHRSLKSVGVALHKGWARDLMSGWGVGIIMIAVVSAITIIFRQGEFHLGKLGLSAVFAAFARARCSIYWLHFAKR